MKLWATLPLVLTLVLSCQREPSTWISLMASSHAQIDQAIAANNLPTARKILQKAWDEEVPAHVAGVDRIAIRQDLAFRASQLELHDNHFELALSWADRGLALGTPETVMTANLWMSRGHALEKMGQPRAAMEDLHRALLLNELLLQRTLEKKESLP